MQAGAQTPCEAPYGQGGRVFYSGTGVPVWGPWDLHFHQGKAETCFCAADRRKPVQEPALYQAVPGGTQDRD